MVHVTLPASMKVATGGQTEFEIEAANMQEVLARLGEQHPKLKPILERGVSVSINDQFARDPTYTPIPPDSRIHVLPRMAGG